MIFICIFASRCVSTPISIIAKIVIVMKKSILKAALGTVIMLGILWVGCEEVGKMTWGFVFGKIIALCVIGVCGYFLGRICDAEKEAHDEGA